MTYQYLRLGPNDLQRVRDLLAVFSVAFDEPNTYLSAQPHDSYFHRLLSQSHFISLTAVNGDEVVAGLTAYVLDKFERQRSEIYIYDLAVSNAHRRKGMATALIRFLLDIAQSYNAWVIFVQADLGDESAMKLYASLGCREDVRHFDIPVAMDSHSTF